MGAAIAGLFNNLATEASTPARSIATLIIMLVGIALIMMPWEGRVVQFVKDSALKVAVGLCLVLNAPAIVATIAGVGGA